MKYDEFVGRVQNRARLADSGEAVRAIRATLQTLGERLYGNEADHLAAQLPNEIALYIDLAEQKESFSVQEFFKRIAERENVDLPESAHHTRAVISVVQDAVTAGEIDDVLEQLPEDWNELFEAGSEGEMDITVS